MNHDRHAALDGLARILDAGAPEDLFSGPEDEALFLHRLLVEAAKARGSVYYWEICRTARRSHRGRPFWPMSRGTTTAWGRRTC